MYGIVLENTIDIDAQEFAKRLYKLGIDTRPFFLGMHEQPVLKDMGIIKNEKYPISEMISRKGLYLPSGLTLTEDKINLIADAVKKAL
jgi:perosamine synthetase